MQEYLIATKWKDKAYVFFIVNKSHEKTKTNSLAIIFDSVWHEASSLLVPTGGIL